MVLCANEVLWIRLLLFEMMNDTTTSDKGPVSKSETTGQSHHALTLQNTKHHYVLANSTHCSSFVSLLLMYTRAENITTFA